MIAYVHSQNIVYQQSEDRSDESSYKAHSVSSNYI